MNRFIVLRDFILDGERVRRDTVVTVHDGQVAAGLLEANKVAPADERTNAAVKRHDVVSWGMPDDRDHPAWTVRATMRF